MKYEYNVVLATHSLFKAGEVAVAYVNIGLLSTRVLPYIPRCLYPANQTRGNTNIADRQTGRTIDQPETYIKVIIDVTLNSQEKQRAAFVVIISCDLIT